MPGRTRYCSAERISAATEETRPLPEVGALHQQGQLPLDRLVQGADRVHAQERDHEDQADEQHHPADDPAAKAAHHGQRPCATSVARLATSTAPPRTIPMYTFWSGTSPAASNATTPVTPSNARSLGADGGERAAHRLPVGPGTGDDVAEQIDRVVGRGRRLVGQARVRELAAVRLDEFPVGLGRQRREVGGGEIDPLGQRAGGLDPFEPVAAEHRHRQSAAPGLPDHFLGLAPVAGHDQELDPLVAREAVEVRPDVRLVAEIRIDRLEPAAEPDELIARRSAGCRGRTDRSGRARRRARARGARGPSARGRRRGRDRWGRPGRCGRRRWTPRARTTRARSRRRDRRRRCRPARRRAWCRRTDGRRPRRRPTRRDRWRRRRRSRGRRNRRGRPARAGRPLIPPVALISSAASSAASFIGSPIGSLNEPATPIRTGPPSAAAHPESSPDHHRRGESRRN